MNPLIIEQLPTLRQPVLILSFSGWNDAGEAATSAAQAPGRPTLITAEADARVRESSPDENDGNGSTLRADGAGDSEIESFLRFTVTEVAGPIQSARLRVYVTDNGTDNGPAVHTTDSSWDENSITWNNRPAAGATGPVGHGRRDRQDEAADQPMAAAVRSLLNAYIGELLDELGEQDSAHADQIMHGMLETAGREDSYTLEVRVSNGDAIKLYEGLGFVARLHVWMIRATCGFNPRCAEISHENLSPTLDHCAHTV